jgi:hypothetical protein
MHHKLTRTERIIMTVLGGKTFLTAAEIQKQTLACDVTLPYSLRSLTRLGLLIEVNTGVGTWKERRIYSLLPETSWKENLKIIPSDGGQRSINP